MQRGASNYRWWKLLNKWVQNIKGAGKHYSCGWCGKLAWMYVYYCPDRTELISASAAVGEGVRVKTCDLLEHLESLDLQK